MILKEISLKNFKSHRNTKISFDKGINLIAGRNGSGKSSILDAILVALYGVRQGYARKADLIQIGAEDYSIEILFEHGNRDYRIIRRSDGVSELHGEVRIEGDQKINEWVERNLSPFHVFTGAVYVRQGEIETIISDESGREKIIRKITRIEDYETAWKNLGVVIKELESELKRYLEVTKQKEDLERKLKEKEQGITEIKEEIVRCENRLKELRELLTKISLEKKRFDELKDRLNTLNTEIIKLDGEIGGLKNRLEVLSRQKTELDLKITSLKSSLKEFERVEREARRYLDLSEFHKSFLKSIQDIESKIKDLEIEKERVLAELKKCEDERNNLERIKSEISEIEKRIWSLSDDAERWQKIRLKVERKIQIENILYEKNLSLEKIESAFAKIQKAREFDKALKEEFEKISAQKGSLMSEEKRISEILEKLKYVVGVCPVCGRELSNQHREELLKKYSAEIGNIKERLRRIEEKEIKMKEERRKVEEALAKQDSVLKFKQLADELKKISEELKNVDENKLRSSNEELEKLKTRMEFLKENERKALEILQKFDSILTTLESIKAKHLEAQRKRDAIINQLAQKNFSSLDELEKEIYRLRKSYEDWIGLKKAKEELDSAESKLKDVKTELEKISDVIKLKSNQLNEKMETLTNLRSRYDEMRHQELERSEKEVSKEIAGLEERVSVLKKSLDSFIADKDYLEKQLKIIEESERKVKILEKAIPELNKIREKFASYKNIVAEVALKEVEKYASEIFEEFTEGKYSGIKLKRVFEYGKERLKIFIIHQGEERETSFLSGGELVALGIAFRLALSMFEARGRIPLLIMDEPTPFLDEERRRKLVEITMNYLRRIPQVIIVSHDEELKDAADKVIMVEYRGGVSYVASQ
ncbi:MAG: DNA double-strand break repair ATPase Rad50 [Archaeoglobaceae archaeon]